MICRIAIALSAYTLIVAALLTSRAAPGFAAPKSDMELQRCVWACLANSSGNIDPRYHACVERRCVESKPVSKRKRK